MAKAIEGRRTAVSSTVWETTRLPGAWPEQLAKAHWLMAPCMWVFFGAFASNNKLSA